MIRLNNSPRHAIAAIALALSFASAPSAFADAAASGPISITNLRVHVLVHGARDDLDFRRPL